MAATRHDKHGDSDRESHINQIKQRLEEMMDGQMVAWEAETLPITERENFWRRVMGSIAQARHAYVALPHAQRVRDDHGYAGEKHHQKGRFHGDRHGSKCCAACPALDARVFSAGWPRWAYMSARVLTGTQRPVIATAHGLISGRPSAPESGTFVAPPDCCSNDVNRPTRAEPALHVHNRRGTQHACVCSKCHTRHCPGGVGLWQRP